MSRILIGLAAIWLFAGGFGETTNVACGNNLLPQRNCKPCKRPDGSLNHSPNITGLMLDKNQLRPLPTPSGPPAENADRSPDLIVNVATNAEDFENDVLDYSYVVTAGRVVGTGSNVKWDLNGVPPGTYRITARVDDSCGVCGKTITDAVLIIGKIPIVQAAVPAKVSAPIRTQDRISAAVPASVPVPTTSARARITAPASATARAAAAPPTAAALTSAPCSCPKIMISDPERSESDLVFTTKIFDSTATNKLTYIWTITGGSVVSQDGRSIRVKPSVLGGAVNVVVNGLPAKCNCPNAAQMKF